MLAAASLELVSIWCWMLVGPMKAEVCKKAETRREKGGKLR